MRVSAILHFLRGLGFSGLCYRHSSSLEVMVLSVPIASSFNLLHFLEFFFFPSLVFLRHIVFLLRDGPVIWDSTSITSDLFVSSVITCSFLGLFFGGFFWWDSSFVPLLRFPSLFSRRFYTWLCFSQRMVLLPAPCTLISGAGIVSPAPWVLSDVKRNAPAWIYLLLGDCPRAVIRASALSFNPAFSSHRQHFPCHAKSAFCHWYIPQQGFSLPQRHLQYEALYFNTSHVFFISQRANHIQLHLHLYLSYIHPFPHQLVCSLSCG